MRWPKNPKVAFPITPSAAIEIRTIVANAFLVMVVMIVMQIMMKMIMKIRAMKMVILLPFCTEPREEANSGGVDARSDRELKWNRFWGGSVLGQSLIRVSQVPQPLLQVR